MKILTKISFVIFGAALITVFSTGYIVFSESQSALRSVSRQQQIELGNRLVDTIDRLLYERYLDIGSIAAERSVKDYLRDGGDKPAIQAAMSELLSLTGPWDFLFVTDTGGAIVLSTEEFEVEEQKNVRTESNHLVAFDAAMRGEIYYSDVVVSDDTGKPTITFAAPVRDDRDPQKKIIGVVIADFALRAITDILVSASVMGDADLYTREGVFIASNEVSEEHELLVREEIASGLIKDILAKPVGYFNPQSEADPEGRFDTHNTHAVSDGHLAYGGNQWVLFISAPADIVFASAASTSMRIALDLVPAVLLAAVLILISLNILVVRPTVYLTESTEVFARGLLGERVEVKSHDELGQLAAAFNTMSERLQESFNNLRMEKGKIDMLIESISEGAVTIDLYGKITLWNRAAEELSGWDRKQAVGRPIKDVLQLASPDGRIKAGEIIDAVLGQKKQKAELDKLSLVRKDGEEIPVQVIAAPVTDAAGKSYGAIVVIRGPAGKKIRPKG